MKITSQKGFLGIDQRVKIQNSVSAANKMKNFRITESGSLTKRPDIVNVTRFDADIKGLWCGIFNNEEILITVSDGFVFKLVPNDKIAIPQMLGEVGLGVCHIFEFGGYLYFKTDTTYQKYDGVRLTDIVGYIPTIAINCLPNGEGEIFEPINLICDMRRQLFSGDGNATAYKIAEDGVESLVSVTIDGNELTSGYVFDSATRQINFETPPKEAINNVEVVYAKFTPQEDKNRILKCTNIMFFGGNSDGRAFLWGNPDYPNYRFYSELANGAPSVEYFPVNAYTVIGNTKINCIAQQYDKQLIFTKDRAYYSYSELKTDSLGNLYASFPVYALNGNKGCLFEMQGVNIDNRPVTFCDDGLNMWESTSVVNEKNAVCFSQPICDTVRDVLRRGVQNVKLFDFQANRELYFIVEDTAYIYNYGNGSWYCYDNMSCEHFTVFGTKLYFSYGNTLYMLSDDNNPSSSECVWESAFLTNGQNSGFLDVVGFDADLYVKGPINITFSFVKDNNTALAREFRFAEGDEGFRRISFRPAIKRTMPFALTHSVVGHGLCVLHGVNIKTRTKERSKRNGIL